MDIELTAATERALCEAAAWRMDDSGAFVETAAVLLGLLAEAECRAATTLMSLGVDAAAVHEQWPSLRRTSGRDGAASATSEGDEFNALFARFSPDLKASVGAAWSCLADLPHPITLATEHLLLGLAAAEHEVGRWLRRHKLDTEALREEILGQYGISASPLRPEISPGDGSLFNRFASGQADECDTSAKRGCPQVVPAERGSGVAEPGSAAQGEDASIVRLLDASANRAREALRVIEDHVRFVLDDRHLTERLKVLRHDLTTALGTIPVLDRLAMRDTQVDVGTSISTETEKTRASTADVLTANFTRLQESLRSLEEFGKIGNARNSELIEQIRYRTYTLHKAVHGTVLGRERLADARLYVLVDGCGSVDTFERLVCSLVEVGVHVLQLRDKVLDDRLLLDRARRLRKLTEASQTLFIMNDRPDLAILAEADGVHVGQEELTVRDVRRIVGPRMLVGVSTHRIEQARQSVLDGASYLGVGPTFVSGTKSFGEFPGLAFAREVATEIRLPAFAIGGIDGANLEEVLGTGIGRVAVSGAVISAGDPAAAAEDLLKRLQVEGR